MRFYAGWDATNNVPTGPTQVYRADRPGSYTETLTMSATPMVSAGRPTGTEAVSGVQTLSRSYISTGGQVASTRAYLRRRPVDHDRRQQRRRARRADEQRPPRAR